jgi:hypothetical protein
MWADVPADLERVAIAFSGEVEHVDAYETVLK